MSDITKQFAKALNNYKGANALEVLAEDGLIKTLMDLSALGEQSTGSATDVTNTNDEAQQEVNTWGLIQSLYLHRLSSEPIAQRESLKSICQEDFYVSPAQLADAAVQTDDVLSEMNVSLHGLS